jgi:hypothetical protein
MGEIAREIGRTVREAIDSWPRTARLCILLIAVALAGACYLR